MSGLRQGYEAIQEQWNALRRCWEEVRGSWTDELAVSFERDVFRPLEEDMRAIEQATPEVIAYVEAALARVPEP